MSRPPMKAFTREEAIEILEEVKELDDSIYQYNSKYLDALEMAIKELEAQDDDAISRQDVRRTIDDWVNSGEYAYTNATHYLRKRIDALPSVIPKQTEITPVICDECEVGNPCMYCKYKFTAKYDAMKESEEQR